MAQPLTEISAITKAAVAAVDLLKIIAIFFHLYLLEALRLDSARNGFFRIFDVRVPRAAVPRRSWFLRQSQPFPMVALNALHNGVFDPAM
jgi:hypothetical protein